MLLILFLQYKNSRALCFDCENLIFTEKRILKNESLTSWHSFDGINKYLIKNYYERRTAEDEM